DYLVEEELRLCLEAEECMRLEHEKNIIEEQRFRVNEAKIMKLEEEKMLEISELKKKAARVYEFNSCEKHIGKHIDLWVDYIWHWRPDNANWAMVSCYFVQILLQNSTALFYANGDKYVTPWSDVDQVFLPINEAAHHWCLAHFDILSGLVTFYDSGDTYDYESYDLYVRVRECL
ncbi:phospholipase-like protein, partial [Tanacetum coccineum]